MSDKVGIPRPLSALDLGSFYSYELTGEYIVGRLFGLFPLVRIHLGAVHFLRLAGRSDGSTLRFLFNWINFLPHRRSLRPLYILQTRSRHRIFLRMDGSTHFMLRQAIGRHTLQGRRMAA